MLRQCVVEQVETISQIGLVGSEELVAKFLHHFCLHEQHVQYVTIHDFLLTDVSIIVVLIDLEKSESLDAARQALAQIGEQQKGQLYKAEVITIGLITTLKNRVISQLQIRDILVKSPSQVFQEINLDNPSELSHGLTERLVTKALKSEIRHTVIKKNEWLETILLICQQEGDLQAFLTTELVKSADSLVKVLALITSATLPEPEWVLAELQDVTPVKLGDTLYQSRTRLRTATVDDIFCRQQRIKAEILATMLRFVFEHAEETAGYTEVITALWEYGSKNDVAMLVEAGIKRPRIVAQARFPEFAGNVVPTLLSWFKNEKTETTPRRNEITHLIKHYHFNMPIAEPLATLLAMPELENLKEPLQLLSNWMNEVRITVDKTVKNKGLFLQAIRNEHIQKIFINICKSMNASNLHAFDKCKIYRMLEKIQSIIRAEEIELASQMLLRIQWLGVEVVKNIRSIEHDRHYECCFIMNEQNESLKQLVRDNLDIDTVSVADLIKWMAYISKAGTAEQKLELYKMQPGMLDNEIERWLDSGTPSMKKMIALLLHSHLLSTQREVLALKDLIDMVTGYTATDELIEVILLFYARSPHMTPEQFAALCEFAAGFNWVPNQSLDRMFIHIVNMCQDMTELIDVMTLNRFIKVNPLANELLHKLVLSTTSAKALTQVMQMLKACLKNEEKLRFLCDMGAAQLLAMLEFASQPEVTTTFLKNCQALMVDGDNHENLLKICLAKVQACMADPVYQLLFINLDSKQIAVAEQHLQELKSPMPPAILQQLFRHENKARMFSHFLHATSLMVNVEKLPNSLEAKNIIAVILNDVLTLKNECATGFLLLSQHLIPLLETRLQHNTHDAIHLRLVIGAMKANVREPQKISAIIESTLNFCQGVALATDMSQQTKDATYAVINNMLDHMCDINREHRTGSLDQCVATLNSMHLNLKLKQLWNRLLGAISAFLGVLITPAREKSLVLQSKAALFSERAESIASLQLSSLRFRGA